MDPKPRVIDLDRYYDNPAACCLALGISQPTLTKLVRDGKVRSIKIGRTRLIERETGEPGPRAEVAA
jgi:excisionase family DNA binding protein